MSDDDKGSSLAPQPAATRSMLARLLVGRRPARTLLRAALTVIIVLVLVKTCVVPIRVTGNSMEPTYRNGRINLLNLLAFHRRDPRRGDVVGIRQPGRRMILMKRILGLPGEHVELQKGVVLINGIPLQEPYAQGRAIPSEPDEQHLGSDEYFVIGDNRDVSEYGVVKRTSILGKVLF